MSAAKLETLRSQCHIIEHPVLQHKLTILRNRNTDSNHFRQAVEEMSQFLAYEVTKDLKTRPDPIETPLEGMTGTKIAEPLLVVPVLRAGNGMLGGMLKILPFAKVGHIGIYRDKFIKNTVEYYFRLPQGAKGARVLLLDPLLATGDTAIAAIDRLKQYEVGPIRLVCLLAAPEGLSKLKTFHPDVEVFTLSLERELNDKGYILPGLGDAGDRLYDSA